MTTSKLLPFLLAVSLGSAAPAQDSLVYFGAYSGPSSKGIYVSHLQAATGKLSAPELAAESASPSYLAISQNQRILYAANGSLVLDGKKTGAVSAFAIDAKSGRLKLLNQVSAGGIGTCHVSADADDNVLLAANYSDGSVISFQINPDGGIGARGSYIQHHGSSVNSNRQSAPHAHFIHTDPSHRFALACDLGTDKVVVYSLNPANASSHSGSQAAIPAALLENSAATVPPGSGPRHFVFSADGRFVHVINEMGCSITTFAWNSTDGKLEPIETVSALPPGVVVLPAYTAAEILVSDQYVYASIRGLDCISVFTADARTGRLAFLQNVPSGGKVPRGLGLDPSGRWLLVANQNTDNVVEYSRDPQSGRLALAGQELKVGSPVDVKFATP